MDSGLMTQLTSIGTLFAFVLVSWGVLVLPRQEGVRTRGFRMPYVNGQLIVPVLFVLFLVLFRERLGSAARHITEVGLQEVLFLVYTILALGLTLGTVIRKYSLIPVLGVLFCAYLLIEIPAIAWEWFFAWMAFGLTIYFLYGYRKSVLNAPEREAATVGVEAE
jgi:amino acid transporter